MQHFIRIAAMALAIILGATAAQAWEFRPYAGFGLGDVAIRVNGGGVQQSANNVGVLGILGADFNDYLGAELRLGASGFSSAFQNTLSNGFESLLAKVQIPATDRLRLYALVGYTQGGVDGVTNYTPTGVTGLSLGGGANYSFDDHYSVSAEWVRYWNNVSCGPNYHATLDGLSVVADYHF